MQKTVTNDTSTTITDYLGGFQYIKVGTAAVVLQYFPHAEGYVNFDNGVYKHVFFYKDHLGNVRMSYTKDGTTGLPVIMEQNHYYPFGLKHTNYNTTVLKLRGSNIEPALVNPYKYKFGGNELQDELGLNVYDYDNRIYDQATGRFWQMDPLAEQGRRWSPYNYCFDNPVYFQDPDGMWPWPLPSWSSIKNSAQKLVKNVAQAVVAKTYTVAKNYITTKSKEIVNAITPDIKNPFTTAKPEKAQKAEGVGVSFATENGKQGGMTSPQGDRDTKQVDVSIIVGLTDVYGPQTTVPGVAPDGSNPFVKQTGTDAEPTSEKSSSTLENSDKTEISIPETTFDVSPNSKSANRHTKDTTVLKKDSAKVMDKAIKNDKLKTDNFNKKHGTNF